MIAIVGRWIKRNSVDFPAANSSNLRMASAESSMLAFQIEIPRHQQKENYMHFSFSFPWNRKPGTYNCRLKKRTGLGPHPTLEKPEFWRLFRSMSGVLKLQILRAPQGYRMNTCAKPGGGGRYGSPRAPRPGPSGTDFSLCCSAAGSRRSISHPPMTYPSVPMTIPPKISAT